MRKKVPTVFLLFAAAILCMVCLLIMMPQSMKETKIIVRTLKGEERYLSDIVIEREIFLAQNRILRENIPLDDLNQSTISYHTNRPLDYLFFGSGFWYTDLNVALDKFYDDYNQESVKKLTLGEITDWYPISLSIYGKNVFLVQYPLSMEGPCYLHVNLKEEDAKKKFTYDSPELMNEYFTNAQDRLDGREWRKTVYNRKRRKPVDSSCRKHAG